MLYVQYSQFNMDVECEGLFRPLTNVPNGVSEPSDDEIVRLNIELTRENQEEFKMIEEIFITFPEGGNCKINSWTLKFGDEAGISKNLQQFLASIYDRFFRFES